MASFGNRKQHQGNISKRFLKFCLRLLTQTRIIVDTNITINYNVTQKDV